MAHSTSSNPFLDFCRPLTTKIPTPRIFDEVAQRFPDKAFVSIPINTKETTTPLNYRDISYSQIATAVNAAATWLDNQLDLEIAGLHEDGKKPFITRNTPARTIYYIGPQDLRFLIFILASVKVGCQLMICHAALPVEHCIHLIKKVSSDILMITDPPLAKAKEIQASQTWHKILTAPSLDSLLDAEHNTIRLYPFPYTLEEIGKSVLFIGHSSGSTGPPKVLPQDHWQGAQWRLIGDVPPDTYCAWNDIQDRRLIVMLPISIYAGLFWMLSSNFYYDILPVIIPHNIPYSADLFSRVIEASNATSAVCNPRIYPDIVSSEANLNALSKLTHGLFTVGAPCAPKYGDKMSRYTRMLNVYGSTETAAFPVILASSNQRDYNFMSFAESLPHRFDHVCGKFYQMMLVKDNPELGPLGWEGIFRLFPDIEEYPMGDVFEKHPTLPDFWRMRGRLDATMTTDTGELFLPVAMEECIEENPLVWGALVCRQRGKDLVVLIVPADNVLPPGEITLQDRKKFLSQLLPTITEANKLCPIDAAISSQTVLIVERSSSRLTIGAKGYLVRKAIQRDLDKEIELALSNAVTI